MAKGAPYLSIVIAARNDNYGGDFNERLQASLNWYCYYFERAGVAVELIIVDYNPISNTPQLKEILKFPQGRKWVEVRIITVSGQIHQTYTRPYRKEVPFYEFPAKNIGIRRAKGEFIVSTNADVIPHHHLFAFIAQRKLDENSFYRADRADFRNSTVSAISQEALIQLCRRNTFLYFMKGFKYQLAPGWGLNNFTLVGLKAFNYCRVKYELFKARNEAFFRALGLSVNPHNAEYHYHTHNAGDFMLMHRKHWHALKGNPEKTYIATHTDALFVVIAGISCIKEVVFWYPVFHQHHERRYNWKDIENEKEFRRVYLEFEEEALRMIETKKTLIRNDDNWGLAGFELPEEML